MSSPTPLALSLFRSGADNIQAYASKLGAEGAARGLIGPRETERIWSRHIINSAALLPFLPPEGTVIDVGSGAGLPGLVIAIARPDLEVTLVEPMERRCVWLEEVIGELGLQNARVVRARSDELPKGTVADAVTARAVAALPKLLRITHSLVAPGGSLLALKGRRAYEEVAAAEKELRRYGFKARVEEVVSVLDGEITHVVDCKRS